MSPGSTIQTLPPELVEEIFAASLKDSTSTYLPLSQCCKEFDALLRSLYIVSKMCVPAAHVLRHDPDSGRFTSPRLNGRLSVVGSIDAFSTRYGWISLYCKICTARSDPVEDYFVCCVCKATTTTPRAMLRFQFVLRDASDFVPCIIFDKLAEQMVGCSALDLFLTSGRDTETMPAKVMSLLGKLFIFKQVFTHGQLYVAISRVTCRKGLVIVNDEADADDPYLIKNVLYHEVFANIMPTNTESPGTASTNYQTSHGPPTAGASTAV